MKFRYFILAGTAFIISFALNAQSIIVNADKATATIQPTMWGIFFEDINFAADGGLYAELVKNRSFEFFNPLMGWNLQQSSSGTGTVLVVNRLAKDSANPRFIKVSRNNASGTLGLNNEGFRGMGIKK